MGVPDFKGPLTPAGLMRRAMVMQVRAIFHDRARGERPAPPSREALHRPGSPIWRVHGDVVTMMVGGMAALLLQMLHPAALAGVWDHSAFRKDMLGRLRRTARFVAVTTYGHPDDARAAIANVTRIHSRVAGTLPDGRPYSAADPALLAWVHVAEARCFLDAWQRYGARALCEAEQDLYFHQFAGVARALGADPVPADRATASRLIEDMRRELAVDARTREIARLIVRQPAIDLRLRPVQRLLARAAIDLLPEWAAEMHGFRISRLERPMLDIGTAGMASALRWALKS